MDRHLVCSEEMDSLHLNLNIIQERLETGMKSRIRSNFGRLPIS